MALIKSLYGVILDSIFPVSVEEEAALSPSAEAALKTLPRARNFSTREACSIFSYQDERTRKLVWALKYKKSRQAAAIGGFALYSILRMYSGVAGPILVIPMPITRQRRRERGFNQCELLTDEIQRLAQESDHAERIQIHRELLIRARHKSRQTMKSRDERIESAHELFKANVAEDIPKDRLTIIVDDVVTTGSTMKEAVDAMRKAGYSKAFGLSLAH